MLDAHSHKEEAALYPELTRAGVPTDALQAEHAQADAALRSSVSGTGTEWAEIMAALKRLEDHIHREEHDLFPAAHQLLDDAAWDRIHPATD